MSKRKAAKVLSFNFIQDLNSNVFISKIIWIAKPVARPSKKRRMNNWVNSVNKNATLIPPLPPVLFRCFPQPSNRFEPVLSPRGIWRSMTSSANLIIVSWALVTPALKKERKEDEGERWLQGTNLINALQPLQSYSGQFSSQCKDIVVINNQGNVIVNYFVVGREPTGQSYKRYTIKIQDLRVIMTIILPRVWP